MVLSRTEGHVAITLVRHADALAKKCVVVALPAVQVFHVMMLVWARRDAKTFTHGVFPQKKKQDNSLARADKPFMSFPTESTLRDRAFEDSHVCVSRHV